MIWNNLDSLVKRWLLERSLPIHYYAEGLFHSSAAIRELSFDTLQIINAVRLPVGNYNEIILPSDFVEDLALTIPVGDELQPVPKKNSLSPLSMVDNTTGAFISPTNPNNAVEQSLFGLPFSWTWFWNVNDYGEPTGRFFGAGGGAHLNGYQVFKKQGQIKVTSTFTSDTVVLLYISDGQRADNATQIDTQATATIQSYIDWKRSPNAALKDSGEARTFYNEKRLLRARLDDLTPTDIKQIFRENYNASIKN